MNVRAVAATGIRLARRSVWSGGRFREGAIALLLAGLVAAASAGIATWIFTALAQAHAPPETSRRVLAWIFTLASLVLLFGDVRGAVYSLVLAGDLARLRAAPLARHELLALKLGETLPRTLPPVLTIALPAALAYGAAWGGIDAGGLAAGLVALWAVPIGAGVAIALALLAIAPASRVRESLSVLVTVAFVAGWLANALWMPRLFSAGTHVPSTLPPPPAWSPATWAAVAATTSGARGLSAVIACAAAALLALLLAVWASARLLGGVHAHAVAAGSRSVRGGLRRAPTLALAFLRRDRALVSRDWPVLLDAIASLALWSLLPLAVLPLVPLPPLELARALVIALALPFGNDVAARALPLERRALAWARLSPVGGARWVRMRLAGVAFAGGLVIAAALATLGLALPLHGPAVLDVAAFAIAAIAVAGSTGLVAGAALGDPAWTDPRRMLGPGGRTLTSVALLAESAVWLAFSHDHAGAPLPPAQLLGIAVLGTVVGAALLALAARVLDRPPARV